MGISVEHRIPIQPISIKQIQTLKLKDGHYIIGISSESEKEQGWKSASIMAKGCCVGCCVVIIITVLSVDGVHQPDIMAIVGASAALTISDIPFGVAPYDGPIGAVRRVG